MRDGEVSPESIGFIEGSVPKSTEEDPSGVGGFLFASVRGMSSSSAPISSARSITALLELPRSN